MKDVFDAFYAVVLRINVAGVLIDEQVFVKGNSDVERLKAAEEQYRFKVISSRVVHREDSDTILKLVEKIRAEAGG